MLLDDPVDEVLKLALDAREPRFGCAGVVCLGASTFGVSKKSAGVSSMPSALAASNTACCWRAGMMPRDFHMATVDWLTPHAEAMASCVRFCGSAFVWNLERIRSAWVIS